MALGTPTQNYHYMYTTMVSRAGSHPCTVINVAASLQSTLMYLFKDKCLCNVVVYCGRQPPIQHYRDTQCIIVCLLLYIIYGNYLQTYVHGHETSACFSVL